MDKGQSPFENAIERCLNTHHDQDYDDEIAADLDRRIEVRVKAIVRGDYDDVPLL